MNEESNSICDLMKAASAGDLQQVQALLGSGVDANAQDRFGQTPLMYAVAQSNTDVVIALLNKGANVNTKNNIGLTALKKAISLGRLSAIELLRNAGLLHAAKDGDLAAASELIADGAEVNARTADGWTALMISTIKGYIDFAQLLLEKGADVNAKSNTGWTALWYAASVNDVEAIRLLIRSGADVNIQDNHGWTTLMQTASENNAESLQVLLENGADIGKTNAVGETALMLADTKGCAETAELIRQANNNSPQINNSAPDPKQRLLLPADSREWLPEGDLALFISDVVDELDLDGMPQMQTSVNGSGRPPYDLRMMVKLLVYAYCIGKASSRKIEKATYEEVAFRVLACNQHPDHDSIAEFRQRHWEDLAGLFVQVFRLCERAGMVKLGNVAIYGTRLKASASKHKGISYEWVGDSERELEEQVTQILNDAAAADAADEERYGTREWGNELPAELARRDSRLQKIREVKADLEQEARMSAAAGAVVSAIGGEARRSSEDNGSRQAIQNRTKRGQGRPAKVVNIAEVMPNVRSNGKHALP